jgi:hypothetical protein
MVLFYAKFSGILAVSLVNVFTALQRKVDQKYPSRVADDPETMQITKKEMLLAEELFGTLEAICHANELEVEQEVVLYRDRGVNVGDCGVNLCGVDVNETSADCYFENPNCSTSSDYTPSPVVSKRREMIEERFTLDEMRTIVEKKDKNGWTLSTIMHNFRKVRSHRDVALMRKIVQGETRPRSVYPIIRDYVYEKFVESELAYLPIHDCDLQHWAQSKASEIGLQSFTASEKWVYKFKKEYGIRSRKTTKFVTKTDIADESEIAESAKAFRLEFQEVRKNKYKKIFNADQVGINLEFVSNRTLRRAGAKDVLLCIKSKNNLTHSVTIMPTIDSKGKLLSPLFVCLQEPKGSFGPVVQQTLFKPDNLFVTCSTSGKMNNDLFRSFLENVILPNTRHKEKFLLLLDTWTPHKNKQLIEECLSDRSYDIMLIPPGTTSVCQPLDTTFNRQVKNFLKRVTEKTRHLDRMDEITGRNNFLKVLSLMHSELSSEPFNRMIRYSWYSAQLILEKVEFENVKEVCFPFCSKRPCEECNGENFIVCASGRRSYCFTCYFSDRHEH